MPLRGFAREKQHRDEPLEIIAGSVLLIVLMGLFALLALHQDHHTTATVLAVVGGVVGAAGILIAVNERKI
jgi:DMSO reductase anchor subunit